MNTSTKWKHTVGVRPMTNPIGIDLFDDEDEGQFSIYLRFADGSRLPARTVSLDPPAHAASVLAAWISHHGPVNDYRINKMPAVPDTTV